MPGAHAAATGPLEIELTALGDFDATAATSKIAPGDSQNLPLPFPARTRGVTAIGTAGKLAFVGVGLGDAEGEIHVLLYRSQAATTLWPASTESFPKQAVGAALGFHPDARLLLVAGSLVGDSDAGRAFSVNATTGRSVEVPDGMAPARAFASVTPFGADGFLVAGGIDPTLAPKDPATAPPMASAARYDIERERFDRASPIVLAQARARHAAVVLESGETLLVGGIGPTGLALSTLEAVSPVDRASRIAGLATLQRPRSEPTVLRLSDGRIFVGGGFDAGEPVQDLEWLSPDAHALTLLFDQVVLAKTHSFAAMPGGGVLGVGVCIPKGVQSCLEPERSVAWFRADGAVDVLPSLTVKPFTLHLVRAGSGAPWLHVESESGIDWRRFDPWTGLFDEPKERPDSGPEPNHPAPIGIDPGAFVWLEAGTPVRLFGFRHDVRSAFAGDLAPLLLASREHMSPNRFPSGVKTAGIEYGSSGLGLAGSEALVVVTDTDYADLELELTSSSGPPPVVVLGGARVGDSGCPWPDTSPAAPGEILKLRRRGSTVSLSRASATRTCKVGSGRKGLALSAATSVPSFVRALEIRRR